VQKKKMDDPFFKLEKDEEDKVKASEQHQIISKLYDVSQRQWSDPWTQSQKLRKTFREEKKVIRAKKQLSEDIRNRNGLHIELLPEEEEDTVKAKMIEYDGREGREAALRRRELKTGSLMLGKWDHNGESKRHDLERVVKINTREKADPFLNELGIPDTPSLKGAVKVVKKGQITVNGNGSGNRNGVASLVAGYSSDSE
jgi:coiled-coil domain-containing protein 130